MTWILTQSGQQFDLLRPTAAMIKPVDIAHALSRLCRFNGHTRAHYSVAQHSLIVASLVPAEQQLAALLHAPAAMPSTPSCQNSHPGGEDAMLSFYQQPT